MAGNLVLLVDDSPLIVKMLTDLLITNGYKVVSASDGVEAINKAYNLLPDIILLDITMPRMNGYQVCRLLKNDEYLKYIPIVIFTSKDKPIEKFWGLHIGADAYETKDMNASNILNVVSTQIEKHKKYREIVKKRPESITLIDILLKTNNMLDQKLYELTIINRLTNVAWNVRQFRDVIIKILAIVDEILNYKLGAFCLLDEDVLRIFVRAKGPLAQEDIDILENYAVKSMTDVVGTKQVEPKIHLLEVGDSLAEVSLHPERLFAFSFKVDEGVDSWRALIFSEDQTKDMRSSERSIFQLILEQAMVVIENAYLYDKIRMRSVTDELTGLYNRRHFFVRISEECERTSRYGGGWFSVLILDIDHFKKVNDTYGHLAGDEVLRQLAKIMHSSVRSSDVAARFGGEEFILLLPETDVDGGIKFAERLRKKVSEHKFVYGDKVIPVTVSIGVTSGGCDQKNKLPDRLIGQADSALYQAKETGRNKVCAYDDN